MDLCHILDIYKFSFLVQDFEVLILTPLPINLQCFWQLDPSMTKVMLIFPSNPFQDLRCLNSTYSLPIPLVDYLKELISPSAHTQS